MASCPPTLHTDNFLSTEGVDPCADDTIPEPSMITDRSVMEPCTEDDKADPDEEVHNDQHEIGDGQEQDQKGPHPLACGDPQLGALTKLDRQAARALSASALS